MGKSKEIMELIWRLNRNILAEYVGLVGHFVNGHFRNRFIKEVPTIEKRPIFQAYVSGNIPTIHIAKHMVLTYLHQLDPAIPIDFLGFA